MALSIKLRCASWQQLATIYRRDLSRGAMFLKASAAPPLGTLVTIDLELPSGTVIELSGVIMNQVTDPQRGSGVDLKLEPLPTKSVWLIESALAAESSVRGGAPVRAGTGPTTTLSDGEDIASAEADLIKALEAEADSLRKLNPFLVLGVGYETTDGDVRAAFGELTKRYHPDRFARYQSLKLRTIAAEIFILIRDAYRKLADEASRAQVIAQLAPKPRAQPPRPPGQRMTTGMQKIPPVPPIPAPSLAAPPIPAIPPPPVKQTALDAPTKPSPHEAVTNQSPRSAELAHTELARAGDGVPLPARDVKSGPVRAIQDAKSGPVRAPTVPTSDAPDIAALELLIDDGKVDDALAGFRLLQKKHPQERTIRAGVELCEGLRALVARDRLEAAQRFEAVLELDPSNERAARELAEMRRQATNERKGLLSRLMGKKESP
ncbi:MAG TPA: J domain-containing protein [Kofleriaceae bacterium]|nr:J domain-containing protein [Kofleriaceae bacterium]